MNHIFLKRICVIFFLYVMSITGAFSQVTSKVKLANLKMTYRNIQDNHDLMPLSEGDSGYVAPRIEVTLEFNIENVDQLKEVEINFEKEKSKKDFKTFKLNRVSIDGQEKLTMKNKSYDIKGSMISITEDLPATVLKRKVYLTIKGIDNDLNVSNLLTKELN